MNETRLASQPLWLVAVVDFIATYFYAFGANALAYGHSAPLAGASYWVTQPWVYGLIAPVALVAAWRGTRQFREIQVGTARWWRLSLEGAVVAAAPVVFVALFEHTAIYRAVGEAAAFGAALGLLLTGVNLWLVRAVVAKHRHARVTGQLDAVYSTEASTIDGPVRRAQRGTLKRSD